MIELKSTPNRIYIRNEYINRKNSLCIHTHMMYTAVKNNVMCEFKQAHICARVYVLYQFRKHQRTQLPNYPQLFADSSEKKNEP